MKKIYLLQNKFKIKKKYYQKKFKTKTIKTKPEKEVALNYIKNNLTGTAYHLLCQQIDPSKKI